MDILEILLTEKKIMSLDEDIRPTWIDSGFICTLGDTINSSGYIP